MDLDALAAIRRDLPAECEVSLAHALVHVAGAKLSLAAGDPAQASHDIDLADRILTLLRFSGDH
jgi:hypothetical protein